MEKLKLYINGKEIASCPCEQKSGTDADFVKQVEQACIRDAAVMKTLAEYANSFGDPLLTGDELKDAGKVARTFAETISMELDESDDYAVDFSDGRYNHLECFLCKEKQKTDREI